MGFCACMSLCEGMNFWPCVSIYHIDLQMPLFDDWYVPVALTLMVEKCFSAFVPYISVEALFYHTRLILKASGVTDILSGK